MLIVDKITKSIQAKEIVKDCSLSVQAGQICGLAGPNGAGKTTLLNCIAGVLVPEAGRIELDGKDLIHEPLNRKALFLISEDFDEGQFFTIRQMKEFYSMFYQLDEEEFAQHLKHFQLEEKLRINSLSKGQKRQALFSIALSLDLRLLMIDEVFDGLDWNVRRYLMRCLTDKISDESMGVLLVSHSLKEIKGICDHCFLMKDQTIVAQQDLLENHLFRVQLVFLQERELDFKTLEIVQMEQIGKCWNAVVRGEEQAIRGVIAGLSPALADVQPLSLEDYFSLMTDSTWKGDEENDGEVFLDCCSRSVLSIRIIFRPIWPSYRWRFRFCFSSGSSGEKRRTPMGRCRWIERNLSLPGSALFCFWCWFQRSFFCWRWSFARASLLPR